MTLTHREQRLCYFDSAPSNTPEASEAMTPAEQTQEQREKEAFDLAKQLTKDSRLDGLGFTRVVEVIAAELARVDAKNARKDTEQAEREDDADAAEQLLESEG